MLENSIQNNGMHELETLRDLLHQQNTYIWKWDFEKELIELDELFYQKLNIKRDIENLTAQILSLVHVQDKLKWLRFIVSLRKSWDIQNFELRIKDASNKYIWFRLTTQNTDDTPARMGLILDITKDKKHISQYEDHNKKIIIKNEILELKNKEIEKANQQLIVSEDRFLSLSRIVNQAITIIENNKIVFVSDRLAQITGYPIEDLYSMKPEDLIAPGETSTKVPFEDGQIEGYEMNFWGFTKNGERKYFSNIFYTEKNSGKPNYKFIITTDRTKEKIQNELLRNNEMKLKATIESLQKYIIVIDSKGFIINYYKPSSLKHFVFESTLQLIGKHYTDLPLPEEFIERILDTTIKVQNEGKSKTIEIPLEVKGKIRWYYVNISIRYSTTGQNIGWTLVMDDITRIKATEMQLKNREAQLFSLINHFPDIVCLKDNENRWILANKPLLELYGIKNKPYLLKNCRDLSQLYPENKSIYSKCYETDIQAWHAREQIKFDMTFDMPNETPRSYEIIKVPLFDNEGNPTWLIMLGRDITNRKKMNQELKIAKDNAEKADQLKTAFLTNMSHELRTPLNGIVGFSQLLKNNLYEQHEHDEFVGIIYDSSNLLLSIINDIIDLSRMETGQISFDIKPVNINELLKEAFSSYKRQYHHKEIKLHLEFPRAPREIIIDTDKIRLHQILNNLVANAYKFTKKGRIDISVDFDEGHKNLIISVEDTGIGIPKHYHSTIFERFRQVEEGYSREYGGVGLGLAISKKLTEVLGGKIKLSSEPQKGSKFSVILPYIQRPFEIEAYQKVPDIEFIKNKRVLAVEDDAGSYLLLKSIFQNTGCKLLHTKNGKEAIELLQQDSKIDLILMDMQMPVMDGLEATKQIKAMTSHIPIIAQTAHAFTNDREKCLEAGCDEFITKPIRFNELFSAMYRIMVNGKMEV